MEPLGPATLSIPHAGKSHSKSTISRGSTDSRGSTEINAGVDLEYGLTESKGILTFQSFKTRVESFDPIKLQIRTTDNSLDMGIINLGTHVNSAALTAAKSRLEESIKQKSQSLNQGEFKALVEGDFGARANEEV